MANSQLPPPVTTGSENDTHDIGGIENLMNLEIGHR